MTWTTRLSRASEARAFTHDDLIAAFDKSRNLLAAFDVPTDEFGQAWDGYLQTLSDRFGWAVLTSDVSDALVTFQAFAERAEMLKGQLAA